MDPVGSSCLAGITTLVSCHCLSLPRCGPPDVVCLYVVVCGSVVVVVGDNGDV